MTAMRPTLDNLHVHQLVLAPSQETAHLFVMPPALPAVEDAVAIEGARNPRCSIAPVTQRRLV